MKKPAKPPERKRAKKFRKSQHVVYPTHGVGKIMSIEQMEVAGESLEVLVIEFDSDKLTLKVPRKRAEAVGVREISTKEEVEKALALLKGRARRKGGMWSRKAQEYHHKINSGNFMSLSEVVRDLHRKDDSKEQSYSERQIYEDAIARMIREVAAVKKLSREDAESQVLGALGAKAPG